MGQKNYFVWLSMCVMLMGDIDGDSGRTHTATYTTYRNIPITQLNIIKLAPQQPAALKKNVLTWITCHKSLMMRLLIRHFPISEVHKEHAYNNALLAEYGISNVSKWNYVFTLPVDERYIVKIAGPVNRLNTLLAYYNKLNQQCSVSEIDHLFDYSTFQTISHSAYYLKLSEVIEHYALTRLRLPRTYLVHVPDRPTQVADENYIIIQELLKGIVLEDCPRAIASLTEHDIHDLFIGIKHAGIWNIKRNIMVVDDKLALIDLEQPNWSNPLDFFNKNAAAYESSVAMGLKELADVFAHAPQQFTLLHKLIQHDTELQKFSCYSELKSYFNLTSLR